MLGFCSDSYKKKSKKTKESREPSEMVKFSKVQDTYHTINFETLRFLKEYSSFKISILS